MIRRQFEILTRWAAFLLATAVIGGMVAYLYAGGQTPVFSAEARAVVRPGASPDLNAVLVSQQLATQYSTMAGTREFAEAVRERLDSPESADDLLEAITVRSEAGTNILSVTARADSPEEAATLANAVAETLKASANASSEGNAAAAQRLLESLDQEIAVVQDRIEELQALAIRQPVQEAELQGLIERRLALQSDYAALLPYATQSQAGRVELLESAVPPSTSTGLRPAVYALLGALAAFMVAAAIAFLLEYADDSVRDVRDLQGLGAPVLGSIRRRRRERLGDPRSLSMIASPRSDVAASFRNLRATLDLPLRGVPTRTILVTSSPSSAGKGRVAANLALAYAETGRRVVLIDADMEAPEVHRIFGITNVRGFARLLAYPGGFGDALAGESPHVNLRIVTAGVPGDDMSIPITDGRLREIVDVAHRDSEVVVIDGPALDGSLHPVLLLATVVDRTILVATTGRSHRDALRSAVDNLAMARADSVDLVLYGAASGHEAVALPRPETVSYDPWYR